MQQHKADYRALARLAVFVGGVLIAAALLSPWLFFAAQSFIRGNPDSSVTELLLKSEFPSYFNRAALLAAFVGLIPLLRSLRLTWGEMNGSLTARRGWPQLGWGFGVALVWIAAMGLVCFAAEACRLKSSPGWGSIAMPLISGFTVATLEEILFRGAVLGILCHSLGARRGLWWTTGFFAIIHFLKPPADGFIAADQVTWTSGFMVIPQLFRGFSHWNNFIGEFVLLFAVGWVLAKARQNSGGLWLGIGLHAGWVAGMKYFSQIAIVTPALSKGEFAPWMVRNTCRAIVSPIVGVVPVIAVLLTGLVALWIVRRASGPAVEKGVASQPN
jgi:uncharacterized protein